MGFEQAVIKVEREREFGELKAAAKRVLTPPQLEKFLGRLTGMRLNVRDFSAVLDRELLEQADTQLAPAGQTAKALYTALTVSDQAQIREFYLEAVDKVDEAVRRKFYKAYTSY